VNFILNNKLTFFINQTPMTAEEGKKKPDPTVIENPVPDEEITLNEAPMVESQNPATNGGSHLKKDDDNGWVIPLDQVNAEEKTHVEDTKL
jgi:hypothetical protein